jgi:hypothetical protein
LFEQDPGERQRPNRQRLRLVFEHQAGELGGRIRSPTVSIRLLYSPAG